MRDHSLNISPVRENTSMLRGDSLYGQVFNLAERVPQRVLRGHDPGVEIKNSDQGTGGLAPWTAPAGVAGRTGSTFLLESEKQGPFPIITAEQIAAEQGSRLLIKGDKTADRMGVRGSDKGELPARGERELPVHGLNTEPRRGASVISDKNVIFPVGNDLQVFPSDNVFQIWDAGAQIGIVVMVDQALN